MRTGKPSRGGFYIRSTYRGRPHKGPLVWAIILAVIVGDFVWSVAAANANGNNAVGLLGVLMMLAIVLPVAAGHDQVLQLVR